MSDALSNTIQAKKVKTASKPVATVSKPPAEENFQTLNFEEIVDFVPIDNNAEDFNIGNIIQQVADIEQPAKSKINSFIPRQVLVNLSQ